MAPGEPCPAGLAYSMDLHAGTSWARLPDNLRARLDAAEAARCGGADERPLAPFPPRPDTPLAMVAAGEGAEGEQKAKGEGDEEAHGPGESALALMYGDDAKTDVYAGMDVDPANAPLRPMPTAVPPPPLGSCERRQCRYHAAEGAHRHRLIGTGQREAGMLASALERYELQRPGQVAQEVALVAPSPNDGQVRCVQLGEAAVLGHHPGDVRAAEPQEGLPLSVRLSVGRLLDEAGLEDVRRDEGLYVALWRGGADAWRREQAVWPLKLKALGSHALLVAVRPEGAEVVFSADRLLSTEMRRSSSPPPSATALRAAAVTSSCWWWWARASTRAPPPRGPNTRSRWGVMRRQAVTVTRWGRSNPRGRSSSRISRRWPGRGWTCRPLWRRPWRGSWMPRARRRRRRHWRRRTNAGGVRRHKLPWSGTRSWSSRVKRHRAPWSRTRSWSSWWRRRRVRWVHGSWEWRTRLCRRRGR